MNFLKTLKAPSPIFPNDDNQIIIVNKDAPIVEGFRELIDHNLLSVPVWDSKKRACVGWFSMLDLVVHVLDVLDYNDLPDVLNSDSASTLAMLQEKEIFRKRTVGDIATISRHEPLLTVRRDASVDEIVRLMVRTNAHRIIAIDPAAANPIVNVISQYRILELISSLFDIDPTLREKGRKLVAQMQSELPKEVYTVEDNIRTLDAFRLMKEKSITGLGVVRHGSKTLIGAISVRDLNLIKSNGHHLRLLYLPLGEYLENIKFRNPDTPQSVVKCKLTSTYRDVVAQMTANRVHRCFVVEDNDDVLSVITPVHLLKELL